MTLDLGDVVPSMAGPKRPEGRVALPAVADGFAAAMETEYRKAAEASKRYAGRGQELRSRPRRRRDRRDHLLHQHLEPERADRRGPARAQRGGQGAEGQAVGQNLARARAARWSPNISRTPACRRTSTRSASISSASAAPPASAIPARCRRRFRSRSTTTASSPPRCCRATAISKAASAPTCRRTISPRRRWSSPTRSPAASRRISRPSRSARARTASRST